MSHVKRPCKICLQSVNNKTGLQCKGACSKWAHFTCLNYSASKVESIKAGKLTILCPCPNCNTGVTNPQNSSSFADTHSLSEVPASQCSSTVKCKNADSGCRLPFCPLFHKSASSTRTQKQPEIHLTPQHPEQSPKTPKDCLYPENHSTTPPRSPKNTSLQSLKNRLACLPRPLKRSSSPPNPPKRSASPTFNPKRTASPPSPPKRPAAQPKRLVFLPKWSVSPPCPVEPYPVPPTPTPTAAPIEPPAVKGDFKRITLRKTKSCCCGICKNDGELLLTICTSSDMSISKPKESQRILYSNIEELCNTVGLLSAQIKEMVGKLARTDQ